MQLGGEQQLRSAAADGVQSLARQWTSGATSDTMAATVGAVIAAVLQACVDLGLDRSIEVLMQLAVDRGPTLIGPVVTMAIYAWQRKDR